MGILRKRRTARRWVENVAAAAIFILATLGTIALAQNTAYSDYCNSTLPSLNLVGAEFGSSAEVERTGSAFSLPSGDVFVNTGGAVGGLMFSSELFITSFFAKLEYKVSPAQRASGSRSVHLVIHKNTSEVLEYGPQLDQHQSVLFHLVVDESSNGFTLSAQYYNIYADGSCSWLQKSVQIQSSSDTHNITIKYDWPSMAIYFDGAKVLSIANIRLVACAQDQPPGAPHFAQIAVMANAQNDTESNFQITSFHMNPWMPECGVSCSSVSLSQSGPRVSFASVPHFNVTGIASVDCNRLILTNTAPVCPLGAYGRVFTQQRYYVGSFVASFTFSVSNCTDWCENGFGFVIHNDPRGYNGFVTGQYGGNSLGYSGATNALAISIVDNMPNQAVALNYAGNGQLMTFQRLAETTIMPDFHDGFKHDVLVQYDGAIMNVSMDSIMLFSQSINIREYVAPDGFATLGFTGAVACEAAMHTIYSLDFVPGNPPVPPHSPPQAQSQPMFPPRVVVSPSIIISPQEAPLPVPVASPAEIASLGSWESRPYVMAIMVGIIAAILVVGLVVYVGLRIYRRRQQRVEENDDTIASPGSPSTEPLKPGMNTPTSSRRRRFKSDDDASSNHSRVELEDISSDDELA